MTPPSEPRKAMVFYVVEQDQIAIRDWEIEFIHWANGATPPLHVNFKIIWDVFDIKSEDELSEYTLIYVGNL